MATAGADVVVVVGGGATSPAVFAGTTVAAVGAGAAALDGGCAETVGGTDGDRGFLLGPASPFFSFPLCD